MMNILGQPSYGDGYNQCQPLVGTIVAATRQVGEGRNIRTEPLSGDALTATYFEDDIEYSVTLSLPEQPVSYMDRVRTSWVLWKGLGIKVKPMAPGTTFPAARLGQSVFCWILHTPDAGECP